MFFDFFKSGKKTSFDRFETLEDANRLAAQIRAGKLDPNAISPSKNPLLFVALLYKFPNLVVTALQHGANPNAKLNTGDLSLAYYLHGNYCNPYLIRLLLSYGMKYDDVKQYLSGYGPYLTNKARLFADSAEESYKIHDLQVSAHQSKAQGDIAKAIEQYIELKALLEKRLAAERATKANDESDATEESFVCVCRDYEYRIMMCDKIVAELTSPASSDVSEEEPGAGEGPKAPLLVKKCN